jgi:hypothetical protein
VSFVVLLCENPFWATPGLIPDPDLGLIIKDNASNREILIRIARADVIAELK